MPDPVREITQLLDEVDQDAVAKRRITQVVFEADYNIERICQITQLLGEVDQDAQKQRQVTQLFFETDFDLPEVPVVPLYQPGVPTHHRSLDLSILLYRPAMVP